MTRKKSLPEDAEAIAQAQANADAELLANLQNRDGEVAAPEPPVANPDPETTIADKVVGMANLAVHIRKQTRLSDALIGKLFEVGLQWHAWDYSRRAQERQFSPFAAMSGVESSDGEGLVGPEPNEILEAVEEPETDNSADAQE